MNFMSNTNTKSKLLKDLFFQRMLIFSRCDFLDHPTTACSEALRSRLSLPRLYQSSTKGCNKTLPHALPLSASNKTVLALSPTPMHIYFTATTMTADVLSDTLLLLRFQQLYRAVAPSKFWRNSKLCFLEALDSCSAWCNSTNPPNLLEKGVGGGGIVQDSTVIIWEDNKVCCLKTRGCGCSAITSCCIRAWQQDSYGPH